MSTLVDEAWETGYIAAAEGKTLFDNPFSDWNSPMCAIEWRKGFQRWHIEDALGQEHEEAAK